MNHEATITPQSIERFLQLRTKVFKLIKKALEEDGHCKSYEGGMEIIFPDYFESNAQKPQANAWGIELHCYVLGPSRHYRWSADSFDNALAKAEAEISSWENDHG